MKKVLITGANGQLGRCFEDLIQKDTSIHYVLLSSSELDITDTIAVNAYFDQHRFSYCINCAAYTAVDKAESEPEKAITVNKIAVANLAKACKKYHTTLVHISTDFVFDGSKNSPYSESDTEKPIGIYGASKYEGEKEIQQLLDTYFIFRTSWLYSEYGHNFFKTMLRLGNERDAIRIVYDQVGTPTYAKDLAAMIINVISLDLKAYGVYHYSNEGVTSWYDFAMQIFQLADSKIEVSPIRSEEYPTPAKRPHYSVLDKQKIKDILNIKIPHWTTSLKRCIKNNQ